MLRLPYLRVALLVAAAAAPARGWELAGTARLVASAEEGVAAAEVTEAVIYFTPTGGAAGATATSAEIVMERKQFAPRVVVAGPGSTVRFPNQDPILHNVFSVSGGNAFDLGLYRRGEGRSTTVAEPGLVQVFCNVHHEMVAYVLVVATPHVTRPAADGSFVLGGLEGPGSLTVWHERGEALTVEVAPGRPPLGLELPLTKPQVPRHQNKEGRPYASEAARRAYP